MRRRTLIAVACGVALVLPLLGCGWEPLYANRDTAAAGAELRAVKVNPIPERIGQRLAWALRVAFNPDGEPTPQRYVLRTQLTAVRADLGVQTTGIASRSKLDAIARLTLADLKTNAVLWAATSHVAESFDIQVNEYASIVAEDDARTRAVDELRRDIVDRLTIFLQNRTADAAKKPGAPSLR